jgi:hypothetical protein
MYDRSAPEGQKGREWAVKRIEELQKRYPEEGNASMRAESGERRAESGNLESGELHLRHELRGEMHL